MQQDMRVSAQEMVEISVYVALWWGKGGRDTLVRRRSIKMWLSVCAMRGVYCIAWCMGMVEGKGQDMGMRNGRWE